MRTEGTERHGYIIDKKVGRRIRVPGPRVVGQESVDEDIMGVPLV
jgi:hypothetical protein